MCTAHTPPWHVPPLLLFDKNIKSKWKDIRIWASPVRGRPLIIWEWGAVPFLTNRIFFFRDPLIRFFFFLRPSELFFPWWPLMEFFFTFEMLPTNFICLNLHPPPRWLMVDPLNTSCGGSGIFFHIHSIEVVINCFRYGVVTLRVRSPAARNYQAGGIRGHSVIITRCGQLISGGVVESRPPPIGGLIFPSRCFERISFFLICTPQMINGRPLKYPMVGGGGLEDFFIPIVSRL